MVEQWDQPLRVVREGSTNQPPLSPIQDPIQDSTNPLPLPENIIIEITKYLPFPSALQSRLVSTLWDASFNSSHSSILPRVKYIVNGSSKPQLLFSLQTLLDSPLHLQHLTFFNVNLEQELLGKEIGFLFFSRRFCPFLRSLNLSKVNLPLGRLIELISFCPRLISLGILNSSSCLKSGLELASWEPFFKTFYSRLETLERLEILDEAGALNESSLLGWTAQTKALQSLTIHSSRKFPSQGLISALERNVNSLRILDLKGGGGSSGGQFWKEAYLSWLHSKHLPQSKLEVLKLSKLNLSDNLNFHQFLYQTQINLKLLSLSNLTLNPFSFSNISAHLFQLQIVSLESCILSEGNVLAPFAQLESLKSVRFVGNSMICQVKLGLSEAVASPALFEASSLSTLSSFETSPSITDEYRSFFLKLSKENNLLDEITLGAVGGASASNGGAPSIIPIILCTQKCLKYLDLFQIQGINSSHLEYLMDFELSGSLTTLKITRSDCDDQAFSFGDETSVLSSLRSLERLDLSETQIGSQTLEKCIMHLENLKQLDISNTYVLPGTIESLPDSIKVTHTSISHA